MKINLLSVIFCILISIIFSCQKEVDTKVPNITLEGFSTLPVKSEFCPNAEDFGFKFGGGDNFSFTATFIDDKSLSFFIIDVHNNFDCHSHKTGVIPGVTIPSQNAKTIDWTDQTKDNISGSSVTKLLNVRIPENVTAGNYHLSVKVIDGSKNESENQQVYNLMVVNKVDILPPLLQVMSPGSTSINAKKGDNLKFSGIVTDNYSLIKGGNGLVFLSYTNLSTGYNYITDTYKYFSGDEETLLKFDLDHKISSTIAAGEYKFSLVAFDGVRNVSNQVDYAVKIQ